MISEVLRALRRRRLVLVACIVLGGVAAVPLALGGPSTFTSTTTVFIPPTSPLPGATGVASTSSGSLVNVLLSDYLRSKLARDVRVEVADGRSVKTVTVDQSADLTSYTITVTATSADVAQEAAAEAARLTIAASNRIAKSLIRRLAVELETTLAPVTEDMARLQAEVDDLRAKIEGVEGDQAQLRITLNSLSQSADRAAASDDTEQQEFYEARVAEVQAELDQSIERENGLQRKLAAAQAKAAVATARSTALGNIVTQAEGYRASRMAGSTVVAAPTEPSTGSGLSVILTVLLAMAAAAFVGASVILFLERTAIFFGRGRNPAVEGSE